MKINNRFLKNLIKEELSKILLEQDNDQEMVDIFVELHNALINREKNLGKRLRLVDDTPTFNELLKKLKQKKDLSAYDLYEKIQEYRDSLDANMYEKLRDAFMGEVYEEDKEWIEIEKDDDQLDAEASDMYRRIYGKPDLRIVK